MIIENIFLLILGLGLVIIGSNWLVDGASGIARRYGISEFVIGMTVVGFGTSTPELMASSFSAIQGYGDMAVGNIVGSNICNILLILGVTCLIMPLDYTRQNIRVDIPICIGASVLLILFIFDFFVDSGTHIISRLESLIMLLIFAVFMYYSFKFAPQNDTHSTAKQMKVSKAITLSLLGLSGLVFGGKLFVNETINIAHNLNISEAFISITLMAVGTSIPELATCIVAAIKKHNEIALGNIIGSNIFNILFILGISGLIRPMELHGITTIDNCMMLFSSIVLLVASFSFKRKRIDRYDAVIFLSCYSGYIWWLLSRL